MRDNREIMGIPMVAYKVTTLLQERLPVSVVSCIQDSVSVPVSF